MAPTWGVLQEAFGGTACETCADDNLFGPSCAGGMSDVCVIRGIWKDGKPNVAYVAEDHRKAVCGDIGGAVNTKRLCVATSTKS